ncbi:MAG: hypothetical protein M3O35_12180 [Acidobacteriota bacterium]|nr:hypothetical protein [Acidobacteriota bacterium]
MRVRIVRSGFFRLGVVLPALVSMLSAQDKAPKGPEWNYITIYKVKPEKRLEFEGIQKEVSAAYKQAGVPFRAVWQTTFGDINEYVSASPLVNFAAMDGDSPLVKALGKDKSADLLRRSAATLNSATRVATMTRADLSTGAGRSGPPAYAVIILTHVASGRALEYEAWLKSDYVPAFKKGGGEYYVEQAVFGGGPDLYVSASPIPNMATLDGGPPTWKSVGVAGAAKMQAKMAGIITSLELSVSRFRTELSYFGK